MPIEAAVPPRAGRGWNTTHQKSNAVRKKVACCAACMTSLVTTASYRDGRCQIQIARPWMRNAAIGCVSTLHDRATDVVFAQRPVTRLQCGESAHTNGMSGL